MNKINLFFSKKDYIKKLTDDDVINVIGCKGSGKTTSSMKYINTGDYIVVNCDRLFDMPSDDGIKDKELDNIRKMLLEKYEKIEDGNIFYKYYIDIIDYIKSKNKKCLIEGNVLQDITPITKLKGTVIIKRTSIIKSLIRSIKRDYKNSYFMKLEIEKHGKLGKIYRLKNIIKRRLKIFKQVKNINKIIIELEK